MGSIGHRICKRIMKEKTPMLHYFVCFQMHHKRLQPKSFLIWVRNYFFLKNYSTSEGAFSHNVLYYQQLSIARYQVTFYANNYFELLLMVSVSLNEYLDWLSQHFHGHWNTHKFTHFWIQNIWFWYCLNCCAAVVLFLFIYENNR